MPYRNPRIPRRWRPKFSLRSLLLAQLVIACGVGMWYCRRPWKVVTVAREKSAVVGAGFIRAEPLFFYAVANGRFSVRDSEGGMHLDGVIVRPSAATTAPAVFWSSARASAEVAAYGQGDGRIVLNDAGNADGFQYSPLECHGARVTSVDFSADGQRLASGDWFGRILVHDVATGERLVLTSPGAVVRYSPDGDRLAAAGVDEEVRVFSAGTGELEKVLSGHRSQTSDVDWSADGERLVSSSDDGSCIVWSAETGRRLAVFMEHSSRVRCCRLSSCGRRAASGSLAGLTMIWDPRTGDHLATLGGHRGAVTSVDFSPDGRRLLTAGSRGGIIVRERRRPERLSRWPAAWVALVIFCLFGYSAMRDVIRFEDMPPPGWASRRDGRAA